MEYSGVKKADNPAVKRNKPFETVYVSGGGRGAPAGGEQPPSAKGAAHTGKRGGGFLRVIALQCAASAAVFLALALLSAGGEPLRKTYDTLINAFSYNMLAADGADDDVGKIKFVDRINRHRALAAFNSAPVDFALPADAEGIEAAAGIINFNGMYDGGVRAAEDGRVVLNAVFAGKRYIEIDHGGGMVGRYQNLAAAGVAEGELVTRGQLIGDSYDGGAMTFCVFQNGALLSSLHLTEDGTLQW
jgi:hypothetical protein